MQLLTESQAGAHSLLFIDGYDHDREYWVRRINISSPEYLVLEADTGAAGLSVCQSRRIDCVVAELRLPDMSGFQVLVKLIPYARYPEMAVERTSSNLVSQAMTLDRAIHKALVTVPPTGKELRV